MSAPFFRADGTAPCPPSTLAAPDRTGRETTPADILNIRQVPYAWIFVRHRHPCGRRRVFRRTRRRKGGAEYPEKRASSPLRSSTYSRLLATAPAVASLLKNHTPRTKTGKQACHARFPVSFSPEASYCFDFFLVDCRLSAAADFLEGDLLFFTFFVV